MKLLKLAVLICGGLGIAGFAMLGIPAQLEVDRDGTILLLAAFGLPVLMAMLGFLKPPFRAWQSGVSLACFALTVWKLELWRLAPKLAEVNTEVKLIILGSGLGAITALIAVLKPDDSY